MFMGMFWILRIAIAVTYAMNIDFGGLEPINQTMEIILLFVVFFSMLLIIKRKLVGGLIYLLAYGLYFGATVVKELSAFFSVAGDVAINQMGSYLNTFISVIGIILPIAVLLDLLMDKGRKANPHDKKTDWFYKNEKFDREMDDRADKNNYRTL